MTRMWLSGFRFRVVGGFRKMPIDGWVSTLGGAVDTDDSGRDFFISYAGVNRPWAEWIALELEQAGYSTVVQSFDFRPGTDFLHEMQRAATSAQRTIAVLSPAYFGSAFGEAEWRAAFAKDPTASAVC